MVGSWSGGCWLGALVRAVVVEVLGELVEDGEGVLFVVDQGSVGAFLADSAYESFRVAVRAGVRGEDLDHVEAFVHEHRVEGLPEFCVAVADEETECGDLLAQVHGEVAGGLGGARGADLTTALRAPPAGQRFEGWPGCCVTAGPSDGSPMQTPVPPIPQSPFGFLASDKYCWY